MLPSKQTRGAPRGCAEENLWKWWSRPVSRVLSRVTIYLGRTSPCASCDLPRSDTGRIVGSVLGLAPGGVCNAAVRYRLRGALLPHLFTLTPLPGRYVFCCTFRRLAPPRCYLAPCPGEPGLSSTALPKDHHSGHPADSSSLVANRTHPWQASRPSESLPNLFPLGAASAASAPTPRE